MKGRFTSSQGLNGYEAGIDQFTLGWFQLEGVKMIMLETNRLIIRNFKSEDWEALHEMILQYEASEFAAYDQQWPTSPGEIKGVTDWFASGDNFLAVCLKDSGCFIGFVSLNPEGREDSREYNLGYIFLDF
jgi:RimJ/RimL family protein N-acetyltransferase